MNVGSCTFQVMGSCQRQNIVIIIFIVIVIVIIIAAMNLMMGLVSP
mgnify:CR=1 FL=1